MSADFHDHIVAILPKLRIQALALTKNRTAADDLVQDAVVNALKAQASFIPGTNFPAWVHRILRNRFISDMRRKRDITDIENVPEDVLATSGGHEDKIELKELAAAMNRLSSDQREALTLIVIHGMSYEEIAEATNCAIGTAKSRVFRARRNLVAWLLGDETEPQAANAGLMTYLDDAVDRANTAESASKAKPPQQAAA